MHIRAMRARVTDVCMAACKRETRTSAGCQVCVHPPPGVDSGSHLTEPQHADYTEQFGASVNRARKLLEGGLFGALSAYVVIEMPVKANLISPLLTGMRLPEGGVVCLSTNQTRAAGYNVYAAFDPLPFPHSALTCWHYSQVFLPEHGGVEQRTHAQVRAGDRQLGLQTLLTCHGAICVCVVAAT